MISDGFIWVGPMLEPYFQGTVARRTAPDLMLMPEDDSVEVDPHIWLSPLELASIADAVTAYLTQLKPESETLFQQRNQQFQQQLGDLGSGLQQQLADLKLRQLLVYHDGFGHLLQYLKVEPAWVIAENTDVGPGLRHAFDLNQRIKSGTVDCIITEPQFHHKSLDKIRGDSDVPVVEVDIMGAGQQSISEFFEQLGQALATCL